MHTKTPKLLEDIRDAAQFIIDLSRGRSLEDYSRNRILRQTIERSFEIIGEAMNRIAKVDPQTAARIGDHSRIIAFRNALAHGYDLIEDDRVWSVVQSGLPTLLAAVQGLIARIAGPD